MMWAISVVVMGLPTIVLIAWTMWLGFAALMAKWHGIDGLKAAPEISAGFRPVEWAALGHKSRLASGSRRATATTMASRANHKRPRPGSDLRGTAPRSGALTITSKAYSATATGLATERINQALGGGVSESGPRDNHDSSGCQIFGNLIQVGQNDG
jgi:hypothetical protein